MYRVHVCAVKSLGPGGIIRGVESLFKTRTSQVFSIYLSQEDLVLSSRTPLHAEIQTLLFCCFDSGRITR